MDIQWNGFVRIKVLRIFVEFFFSVSFFFLSFFSYFLFSFFFFVNKIGSCYLFEGSSVWKRIWRRILEFTYSIDIEKWCGFAAYDFLSLSFSFIRWIIVRLKITDVREWKTGSIEIGLNLCRRDTTYFLRWKINSFDFLIFAFLFWNNDEWLINCYLFKNRHIMKEIRRLTEIRN